MSHVLVIDDDPQLVRALRINLRAHGYDVTAAPDGRTGLQLAGRHPADVVILDLGLPDLSGIDVVHGLRGWTSVPIIVLSARDTEAAKIAALDAGADDYVTKPFGMGELHARLRSALRRAVPAGPEQSVVQTDAFTVDLAERRVTRPDGAVRLTPTEWHLLELLVRNTGKPVQHRQLLEAIWGPQYASQINYLRVHMANLRRKLEPDPARPRYLHTEPNFGYRFEADGG
jgi:two-component system KDP operon response regulator KdpE